jgi:hypothetical protein
MSANRLTDKLLIDAYKQLRSNIAKNPTQKNALIIQYMDIVDNYTKKSLLVTNEEDNSDQIRSLLKNPFEVNIYNNYKKESEDYYKTATQSKQDILNLISKYNLK